MTVCFQDSMARMIADRQAAGLNGDQRDLLSNLIRASDESGTLTTREVIGSGSPRIAKTHRPFDF